MAAAPAKTSIHVSGCLVLMLPALNNRKLMTRLNSDHSTLVVDDDKPFPGGFEKGDGNLLPGYAMDKMRHKIGEKHSCKKTG